MSKPLVGILMGSASDGPVMDEAKVALRRFGIEYEDKVISAHRTPELAREYARTARERGVDVIIAGAGRAAHLAGALAAQTTVPVIGVPIVSGEMGGMDALLSTVQMPPGVPVATVGTNGARNAGILAAQMLSLKYPEIADELAAFKQELAEKVIEPKKKA